VQKILMFLLILSAVTPGVTFGQQPIIVDHNCVDAFVIPQNFLDSARTLDVFFNHQSVGRNILQGLSALASQDQIRYSCAIISTPSATWYDTNNGVGDFTIGSNLYPDTKVDGLYNYIVTRGYGNHVKVAMMKFCYADFQPWSTWTGQQVWNYYRPMMESLEAAYPHVTFVWWTCALHTSSGNHEHEEFNSRVRQYCNANNKILFDLAAIECHDPNGSLVLDASGHPALYSGYTTDGGHLNATGGQRVAKAWWWLMAQIQGWTALGSSPPASNSASGGGGGGGGCFIDTLRHGTQTSGKRWIVLGLIAGGFANLLSLRIEN
jgi:hypothetical protein